ncbi:hypothetical protein SCLCIDRAFT_1225039, partial [Scleroderma citrinum Foug A]
MLRTVSWVQGLPDSFPADPVGLHSNSTQSTQESAVNSSVRRFDPCFAPSSFGPGGIHC